MCSFSFAIGILIDEYRVGRGGCKEGIDVVGFRDYVEDVVFIGIRVFVVGVDIGEYDYEVCSSGFSVKDGSLEEVYQFVVIKGVGGFSIFIAEEVVG